MELLSSDRHEKDQKLKRELKNVSVLSPQILFRKMVPTISFDFVATPNNFWLDIFSQLFNTSEVFKNIEC